MKNILRMVLMVLVCWGMAGKSYGQDFLWRKNDKDQGLNKIICADKNDNLYALYNNFINPTIIKYDKNGAEVWRKTMQGLATQSIYFSTDAFNRVILVLRQDMSCVSGFTGIPRFSYDGREIFTGSNTAILCIDDNTGRLIFSKLLSNYTGLSMYRNSIQTDKNGDIYILQPAIQTITYAGITISLSNGYKSMILCTKIDKNGQVIWVRKILETPTWDGLCISSHIQTGIFSVNDKGEGVILLNYLDKNILVNNQIIAKNNNYSNNRGNTEAICLIRFDGNGGIVFAQNLNIDKASIEIQSVKLENTGNIIFVGCVYNSSFLNDATLDGINICKSELIVIKCSSVGKTLLIKQPNRTLGNKGLPTGEFKSIFVEDGLFIITDKNEDKDIIFDGYKLNTKENNIIKYSTNGDIIFANPVQKKDYGAFYTGYGILNRFPSIGKDIIYVNANFYSDNDDFLGENQLCAINIKNFGLLPALKGKVLNSENINCAASVNQIGLKDIIIQAKSQDNTIYYGLTNEKGEYTLYLPKGTFTISATINKQKGKYFTPTCPMQGNYIIAIDGILGEVKENINFGYKVTPCASLTVDISSNRRRRCFRNFTTVKYANEGYAAAENVQLRVIYPQYVVPIRSSVAWTSRQDTVITYNLGRLAAGQTGQIVITDSVICGNESIRGLTQCTKAIISPKSTCLATNPNWDKADLQAFSQCVGAKNVKLSVVNTGEAMRDSTAWRLFLNGVLKQQGRLKLGKGENYSFEILAKGNTVRLEADQTPNHPVGKYALTTIERCGGAVAFNAVLPPPSVQLPVNIGASGEEIATSCLPIIDSYDPNDKQVIPAGVGTSNIVRDVDELEFQVRFQNTGSDTAYTVIIRDTLSTALDIASLQVGASSHNYTYTVSGKNNPIITWTFNNINLPAQKQDDAGSNGFVKFKIAQMPNNAKGTKIRNKAGIYFDFNSPIITNETNLTVGDLVSDLNNAADLATIFVCNNKPQPTSSQAGTDKTTVADSLVLSANIAEKGTGIWKVVQGTGEFANASNPKTTVKKIGLGENIYEWSVNLCNTISASKVKITRVATPKAEITSKGDTLLAEIADSYQWFLNGQAIAGATSQTFVAKTNGTYTVEIKKFGVTVISPAFRHTITGIEDELLQKSTSLIPNPAQNTCILQVTNEYVGEVHITISNLLGQVIYQTVTEKNANSLEYSLDLQHFTNGIYLVCLQTTKGKVVKKLVKM
jgi:hypothetical protein